jgi:diguanylate cyclase (GGDEF)-like protein
MIDLGETRAHPKDRYRAIAGSACIVVLGAVATPFVGRPIGASYPTFALVIGVSIVMLLLAAVLLWAQSRVTSSVPLLTLAGGYGSTAIVMTFHLLLYHGLYPPLGVWLAVNWQTSSYLWFEWHAMFLFCPVGYCAARLLGRPLDVAHFKRLETVTRITMVAVPLAIVAFVIWVPGLPVLNVYGSRTPVMAVLSGVLIVIALVAIVLLYAKSRLHSVLDICLGIAALCMIVDVSVTHAGSVTFTVGWYIARAFILIATSTVLVALILQTANVYGQLAKTADRLRDESLTDPLTGLANRRAFDLRLAQVLADGARMNRGAAMLMIDVDNFKLFNDAYGHLGGDECLRDLCATARDCVSRTRDMVARYGGEEIAVIMAETDLRGALIVAERIRSAIEGMGIPHSRDAHYAAVTVSIGATAVDDTNGLTAEEFVSRADRALYAAKENGRNRTESWPADSAAIAPVLAQAEATGNVLGIEAGSRATIS